MSTEDQGLTGYSLSLCISDILRGKVAEAEVEKIVASTHAPTRNDFLAVIESYGSTYWSRNPALGKEIALRFYDAGKIDQPRTRGETFTSLAQGGIWRTPETPEVKTPDSNEGLAVEGLVGVPEIETRRVVKNTEATMKALQEGAPSGFKAARPLKIRPRV